MITVYELLEVDENATKEEIEKAYRSLVLEYKSDPNLDEKMNQENEVILGKLKMAYEILMDDEKRKKYDQKLSEKRAEDLLKNVEISKEEAPTSEDEEQEVRKQEINKEPTHAEEAIIEENSYQENEKTELSKEEKNELRKAAKKEFKQNLKKAKKAEEEYKQAYQEEYSKYLRKMGYNVKEPWTLKRVKRLIITILVMILVGVIVWVIPPSRKFLVNLYEDNFIVHALVDLVRMIFGAIFSIFKK